MTDERNHLSGIDDLLMAVVARHGGVGGGWTEVQRRFHDAAGPRWAGARPVRIDGAVLVVEVATGAEATSLRFDAPRVVGILASTGLAPGVTAIRLRVAKPPREVAERGRNGRFGGPSGL